tara:strand:- start:3537 stop:4241 length:705 start_codon:yes stop_codon:yes gene_type:complete
MNDIDPQYIHQSGRHKGQLNQSLLQTKGKFRRGQLHPLCAGIVFRSYKSAIRKNRPSNRKNLQSWTTQEQHEKENARHRKYQSNWRKENPEKEKANKLNMTTEQRARRCIYFRAYNTKRRAEDPEFRLLNNLRNSLYKAVTAQSSHQYKLKTIKLIGCTPKQLQIHIESLWTDEMSWESYGLRGWHVDHIKPCASFDLKDPNQQKKCFHYTNLQPLWAEDNQSKGAKLNWQKAA